MVCGKKCPTFLHLMTIIVIMYFNISPIICYDITVDKDNNNFELNEQEQQNHHPITFTYGNSDKYPWRQKSYNNIESERLPSSSSSTIVGLQQSNQGYNTWEKQNHYKNDNNIHNFNAVKHNGKFNDDVQSNEIYGFDVESNNNLYGIQNKKRNLVSNGQRYVQEKSGHQPLCETKLERISLETKTHIYRPDHYIERVCKYPSSSTETEVKNKICSVKNGFECVTKNSTVYLTRKLKGTNCWETESRIIPSGCECMWPEYPLGDITNFY